MNILKEKYGKIAKCCALFAAFVVLLISPVITTAANYPYILPDVEDFTTVDNIDTTITVLPEQERMSIWGTGIRNTVTGNVTLTIAGTAEDPLEVTVGSGAPAIYVDGVYGNVYYSKNYITSASYLNIPEGDLPAGFESTTSLIQGNLTLDLSNVIVNDNVIGNQSISEGGNTGNFGTRGKTLIILNNSIVLGDLRGGNDAGLGADPANAPYTTLGDIELNVINSRVEDEIVSVGAYLSAGNILINITGNSIVGDENGEKAAGEDGWVIAGTQRPGGTVGNTEINLDTDGAENTILIAGDVNAGSRYNAVAAKNSDEGSVTGNAALNITGGGNVNIGGDVRAYHVAGTTSLSLENVTATVAGTIQEFGTITVDSDSVLNASAIINSGSFTNNGLVSSALDNTGTITGTGALVFNGDSANAASKTIAQSTITVNEGKTFDNNGTASAAIINNGTISGTGTLNTLTASINNGSISQGTIGVSGKFTNNSGKNITVTSGISAADSDALIENYGTITFDASGNALTNDVSITDGGSWVLVDDDYVWTPSGSGSGTVRFVNGHEGENRIVTNTADITQTTVYVDATSYVLNTATITAGEIIVEQGGYLQADLNHITGKITNDEDFVVDSDGELNDPTYIIGDGTTTIHSGATLINNSTISQERIVIEENAGLSSDASSLNANDVIDNNGLLTFTGGTNNNNIESSLNTGGVIIDGEVDNAASVEQSTITVLAGSVFTNTGASSVITGTVYSSGTFTSDVEKMHGDVYNYSMNTYNVNVTGAQDLDGDILGTGRTVITGLTPDIATDVLTVGTHIIEQDKVEIASATVVSNADNLIVTEIANEGLLNLIGGTISSDITGTGAVTISSNSVVNSGSITQNVLTINSELTSNASALSIADGIVNNGTLNFNGGDNANDITGTGVMSISGGSNAAGKTIAQSSVSFNGDFENNGAVTADNITVDAGTLTNTVDGSLEGAVKNDSAIANAGLITGNLENNGTITGTGIMSISGGSNAAGKTIAQSSVSFNGDFDNSGAVEATDVTVDVGTLTVNAAGSVTADNIKNESAIANAGLITGSLVNNGTISGTGIMSVSGSNAAGKTIAQSSVSFNGDFGNEGAVTADNITVDAGTLTNTADGSLEGAVKNDSAIANAGFITGSLVNNGTISGDGIMSVSGSNAAGKTIAQSSVSFNGNFENNGAVTADDITVDAGTLTNTADGTLEGAVKNDSAIANAGLITGNLVNNGTISGTGIMSISGGSNAAGKTIAQSSVSFNGDFGNEGAVTADNITVDSGTLTNTADGSLTGVVRNESEIANAGLITGSLTNNGTITGDGSLTLNGNSSNASGMSITQGNITVNSAVTFTNEGTVNSALSNAGTVSNSGTITGALTNTGSVTGDGALVLDGISDNAAGKTIAQSTITVNSGATFTNAGTVSAALTNNGQVDGTGTLNLTGDSVNVAVSGTDGQLTQGNVNVYSGVTFANDGAVYAAVDNNGTIEGAGDLFLKGNSSNYEGKTINQGRITVTGSVAFDNNGYVEIGELQNHGSITGTGEIVLTSTDSLVGSHNWTSKTITQSTVTVNEDVEFTNDGTISAALINNGSIDGAGTLVLTGNSENTADIVQGIVTVNNDVTLANTGSVKGKLTNSGTIEGTGSFHTLNGSVNDGSITQSSISVTGIFTNNADRGVTVTTGMSAASEDALVKNYGTLTFDASSNAMSNDVTITDGGSWVQVGEDYVWTPSVAGSGTVRFVNGSEGEGRTVNNTGEITQTMVYVDSTSYVLNTATITAGDIIIEKGGYLQGSLDLIKGKITNDEALEVDTDSTISAPTFIVGTGTTTVLAGATLTNESKITQMQIAVEEGAGLITNASAIKTYNSVDNNGTLVFTGGENLNKVESTNATGETVIAGNVSNRASISQSSITINDSMLLINAGTMNADIETDNLSIGQAAKLQNEAFAEVDAEQLSMAENSEIWNRGNMALGDVSGEDDASIQNEGLMSVAGDASAYQGAYVQTSGSAIFETGSVFFGGESYILGGTVELDNASMTSSSTVANMGTFEIKNSTIAGNITGSGVLDFTAGTNANEGAVANNVYVESGVTLNNKGASSMITGTVYNNGTFNSDVEKMAGDVYNYSMNTYNLDVTGAQNLLGNVVGGTGRTVITGLTPDIATDVLTVGEYIINQNKVEIASATVVANASHLQVLDIANEGAIDLIGGTNTSGITGTGAVTVSGTVVNNGSITQNDLTVTGELTSNASDLTIANGIANAGVLNLDGGVNANDITGAGDLNLGGNISSTGSIAQNDVNNTGVFNNAGAITAAGDVNNTGSVVNVGTITATGNIVNAGTLTSDASALTAAAIDNNGTVEFTGGANANDITGTGTIAIKGDVTNTGNIAQSGIVVVSTFTTDADIVSAEITNNGKLILANGDNANNITGNGELELQGTTANTGIISQGSIVNSGDLTTNANLISSVNGIENTGAIDFTGGTNANDITGTGDVTVSGTVVNNGSIEQNTITVNGELTSNASDLVTAAGIANAGVLNLDGGVNANDITGAGDLNLSGNISSTGSIAQNDVNNTGIFNNAGAITAAGDVNNTGSIVNVGTITATGNIVNAGTLTSDASALTAAAIDNNGTVEFTGGANANDITGTGTIAIKGDVTNTGNIAQSGIVVVSTFTTDADIVSAEITNNGKLILTNGDNSNNITGNGDLELQGTTANTGIISQGSIVNSGNLTTNANLVSSVNGIENTGAIDFTGGTNANDITGTGDVTVSGTVVNTGSIDQNTITVNGELTSNASDLVAANGIANAGVLNLDGGVNANDITGAGDLNLSGNISSTGSIAQNDVNNTGIFNNAGDITAADDVNNTGSIVNVGTITATGNIVNAGTLTSDASALSAAAIDNNGTVEFTGGTNNNIVTGNGSLEITGDLTNNGAITQGDVSNSAVLTNNAIITVTDGFSNSGAVTNNALVTVGGTLNNTGTMVTNADNVVTTGGIANNGTLEFTGGTNISSNTITGSGTLKITGDTANEAAITQSVLDIATGVTFDSDATLINVLVANNAGTMTLSDGNNDTEINGNGDLTLDNINNNANITQNSVVFDGIVNNDGLITANNMTVNAGADLTSNASDLVAAAGIANAGVLNLDGGVNANDITGAGDLNLSGNISSTGSIAQNDVNNTGIFNNAGAITAAGDVNNTGSVVNVGTITATGNIVNAGTLTSDASALTAAAIDNNGTLEFTGGTNANNIAGTGNMLITGDVTNNAGAAINQSALTINSGASFTGDADDITTVNHVITNNGSLTFNADGTNANRIEGTGSLNTSGDIINNANITQDSLNIVSGTFTNTKTVSADEITNAGTILNNGYINASGLDNTGALSTNVNKYNVENTNNTSSMTLTGNGNLAGNIYDDQAVPTGVLNINGKINNAGDMIIQQDAVNLAAASLLTTNADYLTANNVNNDGELVLTGGTIDAAMNINDGAAGGNLKITGDVENEGIISQHIDITKDGYLETDANNIAAGTATEGITNKGTLDLTGGTLAVAVDGSGTTEITGAVVNASSMTQRSIEITAGSSLTTSADDVSASVFANNGTLIFNAAGQTNNNVITGNGDLSITASLDNQRSVSQENIDISADLSNASVMIASNNIDQTAGTITNTGRLEAGNAINVAGIIDNDGVINAGIINVAAAGTINTGASNINAAIVNAGTLNFSEGVTGNSISGTGTLNVTAGTVLNTGTIEQNDINVSSSAVFVNNTNVNVTNDLVANGNVSNSSIFNVGNDATIGNGTDAVIMNNTGYFTVANSVTVSSAASIVNDGSFAADTLVINAGADVDNNGKISAENGITNNGTLTTNASDIIDSAIANNASLEFTGGINDNSITGATGNLLVSGALVNRADITQNVIDVNNSLVNYSTITASDINNIGYMENAGTGNITVSGQINNSAAAQFVTAAGSVSGDIANDGLLTFKGNGNAYADNITGTGTLLIEDMSLDLTGATVAQQNINIASVSSVSANASGITADSIVNDGRLEFASAGQNTAGIAEIAGNGSLVFSAVSTVSSATVITQNSIANTNTLTNNGSLTAESFSATGDVDNHNVIKADEISVTGATAENAAGSGTMEADRIVLTNAQLNTSASAISVSDYVSLDGSVLRFTNEPNPFGVASYDIRAAIGSGSAVEVAANTYMTGNNTLFFGDIGIGDVGVAPTQLIVNNEDNLGYADIYFLENGSSLVVAGKADISNDMYANGNNIGIIVENDNDVTLSGDIDKLGFTGVDFTKDGAGTLTLTQNAGVNTYENTNILDGKLIGNTGNINGTVNLLAGSAVEFRDSDALVNLNAISGNGTVIINHELGSLGRTDINVNPFAADALIIESGRVALNGANIMADTVNAKNGTIVQGTGTIGGNTTANTVMTIESGAKFTPGNSIGTINVTGDLNLNGGSVTEIEVSPAAFDLINVSNNVNIASGAGMEVISTVAGDSYLNNVSYDVLTGAAVNGEFDYDGSVKSIYGGVIDFVDGSRLVGSLDYSPTAVTLTIARKGADFEGKTRNLELGSHNRVEVAKAMDNVYKLGSGVGAGMEAMLMQSEYILELSDKQIVNTHSEFKEALLDLAGVLYANASLEPLTNAKSAHVYDRITQKADNPKAACPTCHDSVWANVYTSHDKFYGTGNSRMFTNDITGTIAGYDRSSSENGILLGVMMGGANSDIDMNGDRMDIHDYTLGVYGGYKMDEWTFKGMVYGGYQEYNATRNINFMQETAQASYHGNSFTVDAEASYDFNWTAFGGVKVTPYAGALVSLSHQSSFEESGAGDLNLRVHNADMENIRVRFGLNFAGEETETGNWYANIGVKQILGPSYNRLGMKFATTNNTEMDIYSAETGCTIFSAGLGGTYNLSDSWKLFGNAEGSISGDAYGAFGNVGVSYQW